MRRPQLVIVEHARRLASELPPTMVGMLADAVEGAGPGWPSAKGAVVSCLPQPHYRAMAADFLRAWEFEASEGGHQAVALALVTAGEAERHRRAEQSVELVWTGPDPQAIPVRHTEQA